MAVSLLLFVVSESLIDDEMSPEPFSWHVTSTVWLWSKVTYQLRVWTVPRSESAPFEQFAVPSVATRVRRSGPPGARTILVRYFTRGSIQCHTEAGRPEILCARNGLRKSGAFSASQWLATVGQGSPLAAPHSGRNREDLCRHRKPLGADREERRTLSERGRVTRVQ